MEKSVLVAAARNADARLSAILAGHELHFVRTLPAAAAALDAARHQLIVIDVHFDDSRMFDLLRHIRARTDLDGIPVMCVRVQRIQWASITPKGLEIAVEALGGHGFIDLAAYPDDAAGNRDVRARVAELIAP